MTKEIRPPRHPHHPCPAPRESQAPGRLSTSYCGSVSKCPRPATFTVWKSGYHPRTLPTSRALFSCATGVHHRIDFVFFHSLVLIFRLWRHPLNKKIRANKYIVSSAIVCLLSSVASVSLSVWNKRSGYFECLQRLHQTEDEFSGRLIFWPIFYQLTCSWLVNEVDSNATVPSFCQEKRTFAFCSFTVKVYRVERIVAGAFSCRLLAKYNLF